MDYLFGDSTPSTLKTNFLEFLRDAMDFSVFVLQADHRIQECHERTRALREEAAREIERLERFVSGVSESVERGEKGQAESATAACAKRIARAIDEALAATRKAIDQRLAADVAELEEQESATRKACSQALAALLLPHEPPGATSETSLAIGSSGRYEATHKGRADLGLDWTMQLAVEETSAWSAPIRVERIAPQLEIRAPQLTGWISKEVKVRPQKLDRLVVVSLRDDGDTMSVQLRTEPASAEGFDLDVRPASKQVTMSRVGAAGDASIGKFDVHADDVGALVGFAEKLRASVGQLGSVKLLAANFDGTPFEAQAGFIAIVERLVAAMAPITRDIAARSLQPNELVMRRLLANDRREEIFVTKATLCEKYAMLGEADRARFAPLGLEPAVARQPTADFPPVSTETVRAELPRSLPPAPLADSKPPAKPPKPADPEIEILEIRDAQPERNEALAATLKKIALLSRNGRSDEAYEEYEALFSSAPFADFRPEDQREALRLMVFAKSPPPTNDKIRAAHRAALVRLTSLVDALKEPADYEMLGVAHLVLEDNAAAMKAFSEGLTIERAKNGASELCGTLMRRVASI